MTLEERLSKLEAQVAELIRAKEFYLRMGLPRLPEHRESPAEKSIREESKKRRVQF